ncbi:MAG: hypothetical protein IJ060_02420 [Oscillospiraceae bacterium]|nr:hypothetical protein [Oscillospiraceae bacterium]
MKKYAALICMTAGILMLTGCGEEPEADETLHSAAEAHRDDDGESVPQFSDLPEDVFYDSYYDDPYYDSYYDPDGGHDGNDEPAFSNLPEDDFYDSYFDDPYYDPDYDIFGDDDYSSQDDPYADDPAYGNTGYADPTIGWFLADESTFRVTNGLKALTISDEDLVAEFKRIYMNRYVDVDDDKKVYGLFDNTVQLVMRSDKEGYVFGLPRTHALNGQGNITIRGVSFPLYVKTLDWEPVYHEDTGKTIEQLKVALVIAETYETSDGVTDVKDGALVRFTMYEIVE